jgi:hypothetical protein
MGMSEMNHAERVQESARWEINDTSQVGGGGSSTIQNPCNLPKQCLNPLRSLRYFDGEKLLDCHRVAIVRSSLDNGE